MDKETVRELEKLKARDEAKEIRLKSLEEAKKSWDLLVRDTIIKTLKWLIMIATTGFAFGWNMPENVRKAFVEWMSK